MTSSIRHQFFEFSQGKRRDFPLFNFKKEDILVLSSLSSFRSGLCTKDSKILMQPSFKLFLSQIPTLDTFHICGSFQLFMISNSHYIVIILTFHLVLKVLPLVRIRELDSNKILSVLLIFQEMYENRSDSENSDEDEQADKSDLAPQRIGFNPFSLPFPSQSCSSVPGQFPPSLFAEMEVCEAYGDLSEEEEEEEEEEMGEEDDKTGEKSIEESEEKSVKEIGTIDGGVPDRISFENLTNDVSFPVEKVSE